MNTRKLNLGCGRDIRSGFVNLDQTPLPGVDVVHDLGRLPLPFGDGAFDEILCQDILEHLHDYVPLLGELHRILAPGGRLVMRVPHFTSRDNFVDPTHRRLFSVDTFGFFAAEAPPSKGHERDYYFKFRFGRLESVRITFPRGSRLLLPNSIVEPLVNRTHRAQVFYEQSGLSRLFPAENIEAVLIR